MDSCADVSNCRCFEERPDEHLAQRALEIAEINQRVLHSIILALNEVRVAIAEQALILAEKELDAAHTS